MCNACVLRVYMCVRVHVLQITTVSLSVKLSFLYFSLCSLSTLPFPPFPSLSTSVYSEIIYRVYMNSISRALTNRIWRGDRVSPKKKKKGKKTGTAKVTKKKMMKEEKNEKSRSPTTDKYIFTAIIYTHTCRSSHPLVPLFRFSPPLRCPSHPFSITRIFPSASLFLFCIVITEDECLDRDTQHPPRVLSISTTGIAFRSPPSLSLHSLFKKYA